MTAAVIIESYIENCNNFKVFVPKANQRASQNLKAHLYLNQFYLIKSLLFLVPEAQQMAGPRSQGTPENLSNAASISIIMYRVYVYFNYC